MATKVFIVEDDRAIVEVYEAVLKMNGFDLVGSAYSGEEAVRKLREMKQYPDVIIMDQRLPVMNGIETMKELFKSSPKTKVVFVSADMSARAPALSNGAISFVQKPFGLKQLVAALRSAAEKTS